jgi:GGDEF domain-containing protein
VKAAQKSKRIQELIDEYNRTKPDDEAVLSLSYGHTTFIPGKDRSFHDVFVRADEQMYKNKDDFHHRDRSAGDLA